MNKPSTTQLEAGELSPSRDVDDIAIKLGWHPAAIWGAQWYIDTYDTGDAA